MQNEDDLDLKEIIKILFRKRYFILITSFLCAFCAVIYTLNLASIYESEVLLVPVIPSDQRTNTSGNLESLTSLVGVNLKSSSNKNDEVMEVLKSRQFIGKFISDNNFDEILMASSYWEEGLYIDKSIFDTETKTWLVPKPTDQEIYKKFLSDHLSISQDETTDFVRLSIRHHSPIIAKEWVDIYVKDINKYFREVAKEESERDIKFLTNKLSETSVNKLQQVLYSLIKEKTQQAMLIEGRKEFVLKTLDPAIIPEVRVFPARTQITIISTIAGAGFSIALVLLLFFLNLELFFVRNFPFVRVTSLEEG